MVIETLQRMPEDRDARLLLLSLLDAAEARDETLPVEVHGSDVHDRDAEIFLRLGEMLLTRGHTEDAINAFEIALSLAPEAGVLERALVALVLRPPDDQKAAVIGLQAAAAPAGLRFARAASHN